jgi:NADH-quinone oxidoreductase subunit E
MGTSCKVRGAPLILDRIQRVLGVERDGTTPDGRFTLETVNCLGCCALGPMMTIDGEYYGNLRPQAVKRILSKYM